MTKRKRLGIMTERRALRLNPELSETLKATAIAIGIPEQVLIRNAVIKELNRLGASLDEE
jgi:predicted DNA-binding protein